MGFEVIRFSSTDACPRFHTRIVGVETTDVDGSETTPRGNSSRLGTTERIGRTPGASAIIRLEGRIDGERRCGGLVQLRTIGIGSDSDSDTISGADATYEVGIALIAKRETRLGSNLRPARTSGFATAAALESDVKRVTPDTAAGRILEYPKS